MPVRVAIDCMGGDHGPEVSIPASIAFLKRNPDASIVLVGRKEEIASVLKGAGTEMGSRLEIRHAEQVVEMDEAPAAALRAKKDSSMRRAIELVRDGDAQACVSAGNTGALMAISRFVLKMLPGIDRPAIGKVLPTTSGKTLVLDLGANVDCSAENLLQFGVMGAALVSATEHVAEPRVGLLNIGEEDIKGNEIVKRAADLLRRSNLNFIGNVEGNDIYHGKADVVVCDGFVGNVLLKTSEGLARMVGQFLREEFGRNIFTRIAAVVAMPVLNAFKKRVDARRYNGASLLGLNGVVVKSHGSADQLAFGYALDWAADAVRNDVLARIKMKMPEPRSVECTPA